MRKQIEKRIKKFKYVYIYRLDMCIKDREKLKLTQLTE
jgi:hypothetical protein